MNRIALLLCGFLLMTASACGRSGDSTSSTSSDPAPGPSAEEPTTPPGKPPVTVEPNVVQPTADLQINPAPDWMANLASDDPATRDSAAEQLAKEEDRVGLLHEHLMTANEAAVRRGAAFGLLSEFDPHDERQTAAMQHALGDSDEMVRRVALQAISQWSQDDPIAAEAAVANLQRIASDAARDSSDRSQAVRILGRLGSAAQPALIGVMTKDADANVRKAALAAVIRTNPSADSIVQPLIMVLHADDNPAMRRQAALHLRKFGGREAVHAALAHAFDDADRDVRIEAADSLAAIGQPALDFTISLLDSESPQWRLYGALTLGKMGRAARPAIPKLQQLSRDSDPNVAQMAAGVIRVIEASQR